jgi:uncharacterized membrane protein
VRHGILRLAHLRDSASDPREARRVVTKLPWEYLFEPFRRIEFPDLFTPMWVSSLVLLIGLIVLYNVRTRQLHRHRIYVDMYEWLLWTGVSTFGLVLVGALFNFDFFLIVATLVIGLSVFVWIRFRRFPPMLDAYEQVLAKQRYLSRQKFAHPEATIRRRPGRRSSRKRR